jgi:adenylate kinase
MGKCDRCGGELYQRPDDTDETITRRLKVYFAETAPLVDYYSLTGKIFEVNGEGDVSVISKKIVAGLKEEVYQPKQK